MQCPKCHFESEAQTAECLHCGLVFAKYAATEAAADKVYDPGAEVRASSEADEADDKPVDERKELLARVLALPLALLFGRYAVHNWPAGTRMLTMWVHEMGHATTAWLSGFTAMPSAWYTSVSPDRSKGFGVLVALLAGAGGYFAWLKRRYDLIALCLAVLIAQTGFWRLYSDQAQAWIIFGGDGGCFFLGTLLMLTFYAQRESSLFRNELRWGLLPIGAAAFMDAYATWTGGIGAIPFGETEIAQSDPTVLTETFAWKVVDMIQRYRHLASQCLTILAIAYVAGILVSIYYLTISPVRNQRVLLKK